MCLPLPSSERGKASGGVPGASRVWESKQARVFDGREIRAGDTFYAATLRLPRCTQGAMLCSAARRPGLYTMREGEAYGGMCVCVRACACVTSPHDLSAVQKGPEPTFDVNLVVKQKATRKVLVQQLGHIHTEVMQKETFKY